MGKKKKKISPRVRTKRGTTSSTVGCLSSLVKRFVRLGPDIFTRFDVSGFKRRAASALFNFSCFEAGGLTSSSPRGSAERGLSAEASVGFGAGGSSIFDVIFVKFRGEAAMCR